MEIEQIQLYIRSPSDMQGGNYCSYSGTSVKARECALQHVLQMGGILLTTYDMVRCNFKALRGDFAGRDGYGDTSDDIITWDYMILDEVCLN